MEAASAAATRNIEHFVVESSCSAAEVLAAQLLTNCDAAAAAAAAGCDVPCVTRQRACLSERVQDQLQRICCQDVQWPISCAEDLASLSLLLLLLQYVALQLHSLHL